MENECVWNLMYAIYIYTQDQIVVHDSWNKTQNNSFAALLASL